MYIPTLARTKGRAGCQTTPATEVSGTWLRVQVRWRRLVNHLFWVAFDGIRDRGYGFLRKKHKKHSNNSKNPPDQDDDSGPPQASHARLARHLGSNKTNNLNSFNVECSMFTESKNVSYGNQSIRNKFKNKVKLAGGRIENHKNGWIELLRKCWNNLRKYTWTILNMFEPGT